MPAWPGGLCPQCGQDMPANLVHCQFCRALLNSDLYRSDVEIPAFFELQEVDNLMDAEVAGYFVLCPHCERELRINKKYSGSGVACKFCSGQFKLDVSDPKVKVKAFFMPCPHCTKELRVAPKYLGKNVSCKLCSGHCHIQQSAEQTAS